MADVHPVHHLFPIKKPVFIAFHAVSNLYKGQEKVSDEPDSNLSILLSCLKTPSVFTVSPFKSSEEPLFCP